MCPFPEVKGAAGAVAKAGGGDGKASGHAAKENKHKGVSESGRYACEICRNHFCIDCDVFAHEVIHNCPGCQSNATVQMEDTVNGGDVMAVDV